MKFKATVNHRTIKYEDSYALDKFLYELEEGESLIITITRRADGQSEE